MFVCGYFAVASVLSRKTDPRVLSFVSLEQKTVPSSRREASLDVPWYPVEANEGIHVFWKHTDDRISPLDGMHSQYEASG